MSRPFLEKIRSLKGAVSKTAVDRTAELNDYLESSTKCKPSRLELPFSPSQSRLRRRAASGAPAQRLGLGRGTARACAVSMPLVRCGRSASAALPIQMVLRTEDSVLSRVRVPTVQGSLTFLREKGSPFETPPHPDPSHRIRATPCALIALM
jgi:hypothetical protein